MILTILKNGYYPEIKNNIPFSQEELIILNNSDGLELQANEEIAHYFKYFLRDKREMLESWINNARPYIPEIKKRVRRSWSS